MRRDIALCYHALSPTWDADLSTTPERFERQVGRMLRRGYRGVRFSEVVRSPGDRGLMAVTFDDAYRSVLELGRPILQRLGVPGTIFVPTDFIDSARPLRWDGIDHWLGGPSEHELTPMSWAEIAGLAGAGWEVGSHTGSHPHLTTLDDLSLADELTRSRAACERRLGRCLTLAYPYGDVDERVTAAAAAAGYECAAALPERLGSRDPLAWPRVGIWHADDDRRFALKVSPALNRLRRSPAWEPVARLRGARSTRAQT